MKCTLPVDQHQVIRRTFREDQKYWKAVYFYSDFFAHSFLNGRNGEEYLPYHSASIKKKLGDSTDYWIKMKLTELGLINVECSIDHLGKVHEHYLVGQESKKYRLSAEVGDELITLEIPDQYRIKRRRQHMSRRQKLASLRAKKVMEKCSFDLSKAHEIIDRIVAKKKDELAVCVKSNKEIKEHISRLRKGTVKEGLEYLEGASTLSYRLIRKLNDQGLHLHLLIRKGKKKLYITPQDKEAFISHQLKIARTSLLLQATELSNIKEGRAHINDTNFRLDTPMTNCHGDLLNLIKLDGEPLKEMDLSNSQFVIYANIVDHCLQWIVEHWSEIKKAGDEGDDRKLDKIWRKAAKNRRFSLRNSKDRKLDYHIKEIRGKIGRYIEDKKDTFVSLRKHNVLTINELYAHLPDLAAFRNLATTGQLYEYIADKLSVSRSEAKGAMFRIFFDRPICYDFELKERIKELLPHSIGLVDYYKTSYGDDLVAKHGQGHIAALHGKTARKHASDSFAIMLQRVESEIFVSGLFNHLYKQGYSVITKHDSLLCKASQYDEVLDKTIGYLDKVLTIGFRMATDGKTVARPITVSKQLSFSFTRTTNKGWDHLNHIADMLRDHFGYYCNAEDLAYLKQLGKSHSVRALNVKFQRILLMLKVTGGKFDRRMLWGV